MAEPLADRVIQAIDKATELYYRLVILVGLPSSGKTAALRDVRERTAAPLVNVNLELSRRILDLTELQRALQLPRLLADIVRAAAADVVLLDNIEILFDPLLKQEPLRLLEGLSRNITVVAAWSGEIRAEGRGAMIESIIFDNSAPISQYSSLYLIYATPDHPEYKRYPVRDFLVVNPEAVP